ncbi:hypothetical protein B0G77_0546 [Paraburkholderia sp. BL10I2N1]|nr:hypothetical protein B0G77_0546 [Paraburkholderia sp. BL10I2N1]
MRNLPLLATPLLASQARASAPYPTSPIACGFMAAQATAPATKTTWCQPE